MRSVYRSLTGLTVVEQYAIFDILASAQAYRFDGSLFTTAFGEGRDIGLAFTHRTGDNVSMMLQCQIADCDEPSKTVQLTADFGHVVGPQLELDPEETREFLLSRLSGMRFARGLPRWEV